MLALAVILLIGLATPYLSVSDIVVLPWEHCSDAGGVDCREDSTPVQTLLLTGQ
jgi:hypothetical protein